jgi:hypothetical protein
MYKDLIHIIALKDNKIYNLQQDNLLLHNAYKNLDEKRDKQVRELQQENERLKNKIRWVYDTYADI